MLKQKSLTAIVLLLSAPFGRPLLRRGSAPFSNGLPPGLFLFSIWEYFTAEEFQLPSDGPGFLPTSVPESRTAVQVAHRQAWDRPAHGRQQCPDSRFAPVACHAALCRRGVRSRWERRLRNRTRQTIPDRHGPQ